MHHEEENGDASGFIFSLRFGGGLTPVVSCLDRGADLFVSRSFLFCDQGERGGGRSSRRVMKPTMPPTIENAIDIPMGASGQPYYYR